MSRARSACSEPIFNKINERKKQLLQRLALIGLGSVGRELDRLDAHSDLDFFAIV